MNSNLFADYKIYEKYELIIFSIWYDDLIRNHEYPLASCKNRDNILIIFNSKTEY